MFLRKSGNNVSQRQNLTILVQKNFSGYPFWWKGDRKRNTIQPAVKQQNMLKTDSHSEIPAAKGFTMPNSTQTVLEKLFNEDFSEVRIHTSQKAKMIGVQAFTVGNNIYFAPGKYKPHTKDGMQLLASELTNVIQQREGRMENPFGKCDPLSGDPELGKEAGEAGKTPIRLFSVFDKKNNSENYNKISSPIQSSYGKLLKHRTAKDFLEESRKKIKAEAERRTRLSRRIMFQKRNPLRTIGIIKIIN